MAMTTAQPYYSSLVCGQGRHFLFNPFSYTLSGSINKGGGVSIGLQP